jgi:mannose-6-phosphate isomerase-like protein (cupin superfamily)
VEPGTSVVVPPGVPHTFTTAAPRARWLNVHAPAMGFVEYVRDSEAPFDQYGV